MATPQTFPRNPDETYAELTWAENGVNTTTEPSSGKLADGHPALATLTAAEQNWLHQQPFRNGRAAWTQTPKRGYGWWSEWVARGGFWATSGVPALSAYLTVTATGTTTGACDLFVEDSTDPSGAFGIQVRVSKASPHAFAATSDTYIFVPVNLELVQEPDLVYVAVPTGDPQPATPAGTVPVWLVSTNALIVSSSSFLLPTFPVLKTIGIESLLVLADADVGGKVSSPEFDNDDKTGTTKVGILSGYSGAGSNVQGEINYDGRRWSIGDGNGDRPIYAPITSYLRSANTALAIADTGAELTLVDIQPTQQVLIRVTAIQVPSAVGAIATMQVSVSNGINPAADPVQNVAADPCQLSLPQAVSAGDDLVNQIQIVWQPDTTWPAPLGNVYTIKVRHGVTAGNVVTRNLLIEVIYL